MYSYAHVPWLRPNQKVIDPLIYRTPTPSVAAGSARSTPSSLGGYEPIGDGPLRLPGDDLAVAARERRLHRNFMGYTTRPASDSVAVGVSAIGDVDGAFAQNHKTLARYYQAIDAGHFPIERGYALTADDRVRRHVITQLMCNFHLDLNDVRARFGIPVSEYFATELAALRAPGGPVSDGLVEIGAEALTVTMRGRLFVRNICMAFDRHLAAHQGRPVFSRTI